nr:uncharacterized protein LOC112034062 isoform X1 [Quercus suber]
MAYLDGRAWRRAEENRVDLAKIKSIVPVLETPHDSGFEIESNAIARYGTRLKADNPLYGSSHVMLELTGFLSVAAGTRLKADNPLYGSSHIDYILHAVKTKKNSYKTLITAEYTSVKVELAPNFEMGVSNKPLEFIKMKPTGKVPVVETPDGPVFESSAIARYGKTIDFHPPPINFGDPLKIVILGLNELFICCCSYSPEALKADNLLYGPHTAVQWIDFASFEIDANILAFYRPKIGRAVYLPLAIYIQIKFCFD